MTWPRTTTALLAAVALLMTPQVLPASASTTHTVRAAKPTKVSPVPLIQGVVADQFGTNVDDVTVRATQGSADVASAVTYASAWASGPQHGYFYLEVGKPGTYTVTLSKKGYETVKYSGIEVTRPKQKVSLGEIAIKKLPAPTATTAAVTSKKTTTKDRGTVAVTVSTVATKKPAGVVEIREGKAVVGSVELKSGNGGSSTVTLAKLGKGEHVLRAYFLGTDTLEASSSKTFTLVVVKSRK